MITNILLGLILGTITGVFLILNSKINDLYKLLNKLTNIDLKRILVDDEHFEIIKDLIEKNKLEIYNNQQILYNLPVKIETFITEENNSIHKEIKKLAKISSKIKSQSKTKKNINKQ